LFISITQTLDTHTKRDLHIHEKRPIQHKPTRTQNLDIYIYICMYILFISITQTLDTRTKTDLSIHEKRPIQHENRPINMKSHIYKTNLRYTYQIIWKATLKNMKRDPFYTKRDQYIWKETFKSHEKRTVERDKRPTYMKRNLQTTWKETCWTRKKTNMYENRRIRMSHMWHSDTSLKLSYVTYQNVQPIAFWVSFNLNLKSQSHHSLFNGTWQKRYGELENRLRFKIGEMLLEWHHIWQL